MFSRTYLRKIIEFIESNVLEEIKKVKKQKPPTYKTTYENKQQMLKNIKEIPKRDNSK
jgi:HSP90 family molecular chaperone